MKINVVSLFFVKFALAKNDDAQFKLVESHALFRHRDLICDNKVVVWIFNMLKEMKKNHRSANPKQFLFETFFCICHVVWLM